jgi:hypothetical protein
VENNPKLARVDFSASTPQRAKGLSISPCRTLIRPNILIIKRQSLKLNTIRPIARRTLRAIEIRKNAPFIGGIAGVGYGRARHQATRAERGGADGAVVGIALVFFVVGEGIEDGAVGGCGRVWDREA